MKNLVNFNIYKIIIIVPLKRKSKNNGLWQYISINTNRDILFDPCNRPKGTWKDFPRVFQSLAISRSINVWVML